MPLLLLIGRGAACEALQRAAEKLGVHVESLPAGAAGGEPGRTNLAGARTLLSQADTVIFTDTNHPETWRLRLRETVCAERRVIPGPESWRDLWNSPTQCFWLRRHGLPAVATQTTQSTADGASPASAPANSFILPLLRTSRGEHFNLPQKLFPCSRAFQPASMQPGPRRRAMAIAHCLAQAIASPGVFAAEFLIQPEESVLISRVLSFPWLVEHSSNPGTRDALAQIHLNAILDYPLPLSIE